MPTTSPGRAYAIPTLTDSADAPAAFLAMAVSVETDVAAIESRVTGLETFTNSDTTLGADANITTAANTVSANVSVVNGRNYLVTLNHRWRHTVATAVVTHELQIAGTTRRTFTFSNKAVVSTDEQLVLTFVYAATTTASITFNGRISTTAGTTIARTESYLSVVRL